MGLPAQRCEEGIPPYKTCGEYCGAEEGRAVTKEGNREVFGMIKIKHE